MGTQSDRVRLLVKKWEEWQKKGVVDHLFLFLFFTAMGFFPPTDWEKTFESFLGQRVVSPALQWSSSLNALTRGSQPTAFLTLTVEASAANLHMCICTYQWEMLVRQRDAPTLFKYIHRNTAVICIQDSPKHTSTVWAKEIHHISVWAAVKVHISRAHLSYLYLHMFVRILSDSP